MITLNQTDKYMRLERKDFCQSLNFFVLERSTEGQVSKQPGFFCAEKWGAISTHAKKIPIAETPVLLCLAQTQKSQVTGKILFSQVTFFYLFD